MITMFEKAHQNKEILKEWYHLFELMYEVVKSAEPKAIAKSISHFPCKSLLDVGCGAGDLAVSLKKLGQYSVIGLESEPFFYNKTIVKHKNSKVTFLPTCFEDYSAPTDAVLFRYVFQHFQDKSLLIKHCNNILSNNGIVIIIDAMALKTTPPVKTFIKITSIFKEYYHRCAVPLLKSDIVNAFESGGFTLLKDEVVSLQPKTLYEKDIFSQLLYSAGAVKAMTSDQPTSVINILKEEVKKVISRQAVLEYSDFILAFKKKGV